MKVAIDGGPLTSGHSVRGVGAYTKELINALKKEGKRSKVNVKVVDFRSEDLSKYDLVHYPFFDLFAQSGYLKLHENTVVTIHDLIPLIYPKNYPSGTKGLLKHIRQKYLLKKVKNVIAVSETSKKDIMRFLNIDSKNIYVVYEAPKKIYKIIKDKKQLKKIRKKYNLPNKFVLYVGDINFNKNIITLIKACKLLKVTLIIVGKQALDIEEKGVMLDSLRGPRDWIRYLFNLPHPELAHFTELVSYFKNGKSIKRLGFISDEELCCVYNLASVYCQPSYYEGFGLPVLEAMSCGVPCVISKTQALVEISNDASLIAETNSYKDFADKIKILLEDKKLSFEYSSKGLKRAKEFSWNKTAEGTLEVYKKT